MAKGLNRTRIEWVANPDGSTPGFSSSYITGCLKRCDYCYAWGLANGRLREMYLANHSGAFGSRMIYANGQVNYSELPNPDPTDPFWPRWWPNRLEAIRRRKKPAGIFMVGMGDAFGPWVPSWMINEMIQVARDCPQHRLYFLTKFPERLVEFNPWPDNCWVGATATTNEDLSKTWDALDCTEAAIKYLSIEPLLEPIVQYPGDHRQFAALLSDCGISWVILGPCTGKLRAKYPCEQSWLQGIEAACDIAGVPVFEKDAVATIIKARPLRREFPTVEVLRQ